MLIRERTPHDYRWPANFYLHAYSIRTHFTYLIRSFSATELFHTGMLCLSQVVHTALLSLSKFLWIHLEAFFKKEGRHWIKKSRGIFFFSRKVRSIIAKRVLEVAKSIRETARKRFSLIKHIALIRRSRCGRQKMPVAFSSSSFWAVKVQKDCVRF